MARTIKDIQLSIIDGLTGSIDGLSASKVAEWRLFTYVVAGAIHMFEVILDLFRNEIEKTAYTNTSGTVAWYGEMTLRFQYNHKLVFDKQTAFYGYEADDLDSRIVKVVAISEKPLHMYIKVAKLDNNGKIVPLADNELQSLIDYWRTMRIGGTEITVISTIADTIRYNLDIIYDPATPGDIVKENIEKALEEFKTSLSFDAMFYPQRLIDAVMHVDGVVTVHQVAIEHKSTGAEYEQVGIKVELASGYFDYDDDNTLTLMSNRE